MAIRRNRELFEKVETLQNMLLHYATGGTVDHEEYGELRRELVEHRDVRELLPAFIRTNRQLGQLWPHFKRVSSTYQGRREYLWKEFGPLLDALEPGKGAPGDDRVEAALSVLSSASVHSAWETAMQRRTSDPDGAITSARTLLETVCKHILDDLGQEYDAGVDLPALYKATAEVLQLAPSQQTEPILRRVLGGCTSIVEGIAALRNKLGDAHGKGQADAQPEERHAALAVNVAGAAATFLVETWEARKQSRRTRRR
jgi:hypothetical protein